MNPWQETWTYVIDKWETYLEFVWNRDVYDKAMTPERAQLASAAPEMCRALLAVEKSVRVGYGYPDGKKKRDEHRDATYGEHLKCPWCPYVFYEHITLKNFFHHPNCPVDAALTKAGLPDQESRDAARKELGI